MTEREALKLALEAFLTYLKLQPHSVQQICDRTITAIKEVLAQPEQEPVAECVDDGEGGIYYRTIKKHIGLLYTTPPQPEQEPVARYFEDYQGQPIEEIDEERFNQTPEECRFKLYTAPPQRTWVGLTDEEIGKILESGDVAEHDAWNGKWYVLPYSLTRALEAKLKEKNT